MVGRLQNQTIEEPARTTRKTSCGSWSDRANCPQCDSEGVVNPRGGPEIADNPDYRASENQHNTKADRDIASEQCGTNLREKEKNSHAGERENDTGERNGLRRSRASFVVIDIRSLGLAHITGGSAPELLLGRCTTIHECAFVGMGLSAAALHGAGGIVDGSPLSDLGRLGDGRGGGRN